MRGEDAGAGGSAYANDVIRELLISILLDKVMSHTVDSCV